MRLKLNLGRNMCENQTLKVKDVDKSSRILKIKNFEDDRKDNTKQNRS